MLTYANVRSAFCFGLRLDLENFSVPPGKWILIIIAVKHKREKRCGDKSIYPIR